MIVIVDYQMGNVGSIFNMIRKIGVDSLISSDCEDIKKAEKIVLPGVGAFDYGMNNLEKLGLIDILNERVIKYKIPILGICLGMQLMTNSSEEGDMNGFGWINAKTVKFKFKDNSIKVPHMGWNTVNLSKESRIFANMENQENRFYFVHSYFVECNNREDILTTTKYGDKEFVSSFERENIIGVQFHPEKSHKFGMQLLKNFLEKF